ncbi:HAD family hydrolase [Kitasatospora sp. NPDC001540]|uniref:HAD family hydrolase n=1 Tax=Kitasatospora sp. NPDC001540 TaxID=3364014 RepID=UPI0036B77FA4
MTAAVPVAVPRTPARPRRAAFFDVDRTLISGHSMVALWRRWTAAGPAFPGRELPTAAAGVPREELNRAYYRLFAGESAALLRRVGADWCEAYRRTPGAFLPDSLAALRGHLAQGHLVVLVSGSLRACLDPLAAGLGAHAVLCTEQLVDAEGRLTGEVVRPMIGAAKAEAALGLMRRLGLDPAQCHGYGDHASDLPMLRAVGHPVVVGDDPVLAERAAALGWPVLPGARND